MPFSKGRAVDAANKAMKRGQHAKAIAEYQRIVRQDPKDIRSKLKLGDLLIRAGLTAEALDVLREVAEHYSSQGFTLKAVAVYKQILRIEPNLPEVWTALAMHSHQLGLLNDAVRQFREAARILAERGKTIERLEVIRQMVELDPENVADRIRLAESFSAAGRYPEAVALFRRACEILERRDRPQLYCKVAERLLHHQPDDFAVNRQLAAYYLKDRDAQRALPKLRTCFRQQPRDIDVLDMLQETFDLLGQPHKAVSVLREMARIYEQNGLLKERDQTYERILLINGADSEARRALRIVTAVGEQQVVLELDETRIEPTPTQPPSATTSGGAPAPAQAGAVDDFEEVDVDEEDLEFEAATERSKDAAAARPAAPAAVRPAELRSGSPASAGPAAAVPSPGAARPAAPAARAHEPKLEEIFGDLNLDEELDIQDEAEDTVVVGDLAIEDFESFEFDDGLAKGGPGAPAAAQRGGGSKPAGKAAAPKGAAAAAKPATAPRTAPGHGQPAVAAPPPAAAPARGAAATPGDDADSDWRTLFSDEGAAGDGLEDAFGRLEGEVDLNRLMAEAERAVAGQPESPRAATAATPPPAGAPAAPAPAPSPALDLALRESLEEVDFYLANELLDDALQLLEELRAEYPNHPEILRRLKSAGR